MVLRNHHYQQRGFRDEFINNLDYMVELIDDAALAEKAGEIGAAILEARSLRMTDIAVKMEGESVTGYNL